MEAPTAEPEGHHALVAGISIFDLALQLRRTAGLRPDFFVKQFISSRGNEYFCEIDEEYLTDRFNLTGLNAEVPYYQYALDLITDVFDLDADDHLRGQIEKSARHLYGLAHARYIVTTRGLAKMVCIWCDDTVGMILTVFLRVRLTSTREVTLESAPASSAKRSLFCPLDSQIFPA